MARQTRWFVLAVCSLIVFTLLGLTAIDKYDESTCLDRLSALPPFVNYAGPRGIPYFVSCDGFLPW